MMKRGDRGNTIVARDWKRSHTNVGELKLNIRKLSRALAGEANHLRREVKGQHTLGTLGQAPCEATCTAADFHDVVTV